MSINRNRSAAQKFIAEAKQLGSVAVARVEAHKVYNSYGTCTRCFPHGQETINNKWRNAKGRKWNKRRKGTPLRDLNENGSSFIYDMLWHSMGFSIDEGRLEDERWLELNPEYSPVDDWDIFDWDDGGEKSRLPAGWKVMDVCSDDVRKQIQAMEAEVARKINKDIHPADLGYYPEQEQIQPDAVYHDHYKDDGNFQDDEYNCDCDPFYDCDFMDEWYDPDYEPELTSEPLEMIRLRGGAYVTL